MSTAEHDVQIRQLKCPELQLVNSSDSTSGNVYYSYWKPQSDNETGKYLNVKIANKTDLNQVQTHLENPTFEFYRYWMDNIYTWTGKMDVSRAMIGWTIRYGVTTYKRAAAGLPVEVRTYTITEADFANPNEDGTATIDLLPNTDGTETGDDWEYFESSSAVGYGTTGNGSRMNAIISFHYDGSFDVSQVTDENGDGIIETANDGILVKNIEASSRTLDPDGQYSYYLWWDDGHVIKMCYQWDNCQDNNAAHLRSAVSSSGTGNWGHTLANVVQQLGAQLIAPTSLVTQWQGTLVQGAKTTITGSVTMKADTIGKTEWQPSGDVLYLEFPDTKLEFAGNASIDGVSDPDAYVTTINGKRYLVIHDNCDTSVVKNYTVDPKGSINDPSLWYGGYKVTYEPLVVSFDVFTMPTASTTSPTTVIGDSSYLDFSDHQVYDNVNNNPDNGTYRTAIQKKSVLDWNGARGGLGNGAALDNPLGVHTKQYVNDRFWAMKTNGGSITAALNTNLGLATFSGTNASEDDKEESLVSVTGVQTIYVGQKSQMETLISLGAGSNGLSNAEIVVKIPQENDIVSDSAGSFTNTAGAVMRGAAKQLSATTTNALTFTVSTDGENYVPMTDTTDWSSVKYVKAQVASLGSQEVVSFTLPLAAPDAASGEETYVYATASFTEGGSQVTPRSISGYRFADYVISGTAWEDTNHDGMRDDDETVRQSGVTVTAKDSDGNQVGQAVTDETGNWSMAISNTDKNITLTVSPRNALTIYTEGTTDNKFNPNTARYVLGQVTKNITGIDIGYYDEAAPSDPQTISGTKTLTQDGEAVPMTAGLFKAVITADSENKSSGYKGFQAGNVDIAADGSFSFHPVVFTEEGTYKFHVTELQGTDGLYSYDGSEYIVTFVVSRDVNDKLTAVETITKDGAEVSAITFANTKAKPVTSDALSVEKKLTGDTPDTNSVFSFDLTADKAASTLPDGMTTMPMPVNASGQSVTKTVTGAGTASFEGITFEKPGVYVYQLTEKNSSEAGYTYDTTSYLVTYTVTAASGTLSVSRTVVKSGEQSDTSAVFTNTYTTPTPDTDKISGNKELTQNGQALPIQDGKFSVSITASSTNNTSGYSGFTAGTYDIAANGSFTTPFITFTKAGTYTFSVSENDGGDKRYTYDSTQYTVTFKVTNTSNNQLTAQKTITKDDGTTADEITFKNTKVPEQVITVSKEWVGPTGASATVRLMADGEEVDNRTLDDENGWSCTFLVDPVTAEGKDVVYSIEEDEIDHFTSAVSGDEQSGFTVTNTYEGLTVSDPPVKKVISGDTPDKKSEFTFTLTAAPSESSLPEQVSADAMPMPAAAAGKQSMDVKVTGEGEAEFGEITFMYAGTYVYKVTEKNGGEKGYTYDDSVYTVIYEVTEENGQLSCVRKIQSGGQTIQSSVITPGQQEDASALTFTNQFKKEAQTGTKVNPLKTGDHSNVAANFAILAVAVILLVVILLVLKRRKKD